MSDDRFDVAVLLKRQLSHLDRLEIEGQEVLLPGKLAPYLSLAVHELGTNALKHGSLRGQTGTVHLTWSQPEPGHLRIIWAERGGAVPGSVPADDGSRRRGFGTQLLTKVFESATGGSCRLSFEPEGLVWTATVPSAVELAL